MTNEDYAVQIARDWNCKFNADKKGFVTRFFLDEGYLSRFDRKIVGGKMHEELWAPAEHLQELQQQHNREIEVTRAFAASDGDIGEVPVKSIAREGVAQ